LPAAASRVDHAIGRILRNVSGAPPLTRFHELGRALVIEVRVEGPGSGDPRKSSNGMKNRTAEGSGDQIL